MSEKGLIQIYTGNGKGKTTAAIGLALRAAGTGRKILICQFLKPASIKSSEKETLSQIPQITLRPFLLEWDMKNSLDDPDVSSQAREVIHRELTDISALAAEKTYDMIILDEIVFCLAKKLAGLDDIRQLINKKHPAVELILTGRGAGNELIELADLVTEMKKIKHTYDKGITARKGIEY